MTEGNFEIIFSTTDFQADVWRAGCPTRVAF